MTARPLVAEIRHLYFTECWTIARISTELGLHRETIVRLVDPLRPNRSSRRRSAGRVR